MFEDFLNYVSKLIIKRSRLIILLTVLILLASIISALNIKFGVTPYKDLLPVGDKVYERYELYQKDFKISENNVFIFIKDEDVINKEVYEYMYELGKNLKKLEGVSSVVSPASIVMNVYNGLPDDELLLELMSYELASDLLPSSSTAVMIGQISMMSEEEQNVLAKQIERVIEYTPKPNGIITEVTGIPMLYIQIMECIRKSLGITTTASIILMILILIVMFSGVVRRKITAFMPLTISVFSVIVIIGLIPVFGLKMTSQISAILPILIGLAIEYGAQIQNRYEEERIEGRSKDEAVTLSITKTGLAVIMAMLTTVIGFMSMTSTRIPRLSWFGILMSLGLVIAYFFSITFLPAILKITDKEEKKSRDKKLKKETGVLEKVLIIISNFTSLNPRKILILALIIIIFGAYANTQIKLETDTRKYFPQEIPAMVRFKELERVVGGQYIFILVLNIDELNSETLKRSDELAEYILKKEDLIYDYESLSTLIKKFTGSLPDDDAVLLRVIEKIPKEQLNKYYSGHSLAIYFKTNANTHDKRVNLWKSLEHDMRFFSWYEGYYITGRSVVMTELGQIMLSSQFTMTMVAYALIVLLLFGIYRSIIRAVVPLIAITTVIGVINMFMFSFGIKQTIISIALNAIILGLGIDFSIHITERYFEERQKFSSIDSVRRTIERTGKAIVTSALTMAGGFGALMLSDFPALRDFGFLAFVAIVFSLISALTIVPAFLMIAERFKIPSKGVMHD